MSLFPILVGPSWDWAPHIHTPGTRPLAPGTGVHCIVWTHLPQCRWSQTGLP